MTQNTSAAVMAQRHEAADSLDDFPTPPWAVRAMLAELDARGLIKLSATAWDPAANRGHLVRGLGDRFDRVRASDVADYGAGFEQLDYLLPLWPHPVVDWIITNPPFRLAGEFIDRALADASQGVAMLVRTQFLAGQARYRDLFSRHRPHLVLQHAERVVMLAGRLVRAREADQLNTTTPGSPATTATDYTWLIWLTNRLAVRTEFDWIAPSRLEFEQPGDYPEPADGLANLHGIEVRGL